MTMAKISRRDLIVSLSAAAAGAFLLPKAVTASMAEKIVKKGRLKQSVSWWCYQRNFKLPEFARIVADMGLTAIDLLQPNECEVIKEFGLVCSMGYAEAAKIPDGLNNKANHDAIVKGLEKGIPLAEKLRVPNLIAFFGNRRGMSDTEALDNCVTGLNRIKKMAEDHGVNICVELLNSKVDHKDYQGDRSDFGLQVVKAVASPRVKLLFDIYHVQIMEGDIIRTIRNNHEYIGHYHTGGVPGRHELDDTQELNWATVCRAIADTGFKGYVAHEFVPTRDPIKSLSEAVALCDV
ncbi:MAG TPA: TIM barrel protein [Blastocatellia bacterium]|nr:TIM barrel protein [Blastocatellia bacterium]